MLTNFLNHSLVNKSEWEDLIIFNYSRECQFDRKWDDITRAARGIIFNKVTRELVARPFHKFFNLLEMPETSFENLPKGPFTATIKLDGSLGVLFPYKDQYWIATKGSFQSDQAHWATDWIRKNTKLSAVRKGYTYLFEIIYKANKIVLDYGDYEGLTLLAVINNVTGVEMPYKNLVEEAENIGVPVVKQETGFDNLEDLYHYCKALPETQEGFVVTFSNGLKVKMKGDAYVKIHKLLSRMTPIAFWEAWDLGLKDIPKDYLTQLPEEFRELTDNIYNQVYAMHWEPYKRYIKMHHEMKGRLGIADKKTWALSIKECHPKEFSYIMGLYNGKDDQVWQQIHKNCRPTNNILPDGIKGTDRLKRIQQEG